jgi:hypothetical protein
LDFYDSILEGSLDFDNSNLDGEIHDKVIPLPITDHSNRCAGDQTR